MTEPAATGGKQTGVILGRFAPLHLGHQQLIDLAIAKHGVENTLAIIGSATSLNQRTPYTYCKRRQMIEAVFPELDVIGMPDAQPELSKHTESTVELWQKNLKQIEQDRGSKFIFYGGSKDDLKYLKQVFRAEEIIDRSTAGKGINATELREAIQNKQTEILEKYLDKKVIPLALKPDF